MDYEKKLALAKEALESGSYDRETIEYIFPEPRDNEDERIRKVLVDYLKLYKEQEECGISTFYGIPTNDILDWLEKQGRNKEMNNFDVLPGLYKCVHRMFDGTPDGKLLFEVGNIYKCLSKHDRAEFEVSYGHSVYLEDPVVCKHFIPFEQAQGEAFAIIDAYKRTAADWEELYTCPIMNTPFDVDKKLLWICPVPCVRKYLEKNCGYKTKWYHKLFWKGKKYFK